MIKISDLRQLNQDIVDNIPDINSHIMVIDADNAESSLDRKPGTILVTAIPAADSAGRLGYRRNRSAILLFILAKPKSSELKVQTIEQLQPAALAVQAYLEERAESGCALLQYLETNQFSIDPLSNEFGGFYGWQISVTL